MTKSYLMQPRRKGYAFRIKVPLALQSKFGRTYFIEGLKTDSKKEAERRAQEKLIHYRKVFERAKYDTPLTLGEIDDAARQFYRETLIRFEAQARRGIPEPLRRDDEIYANVSELAALTGFGDFDTLLYSQAGSIWESLGVKLDLTTPTPDWRAAEVVIAQADHDYFENAGVVDEIAIIQQRKGVTIDPSSEIYLLLGRALMRARLAAVWGRLRAQKGVATEEPATFLGPAGIDPVTLKPLPLYRPVMRSRITEGPWPLFEHWINRVKPAASSVNRWRCVFLDLQSKYGTDEISEEEAGKWARDLTTTKRSPRTVSEVWVNAARTIYGWAIKEKLVESNPFKTVTVTVPNKKVTRSKSFTDKEIRTILKAALAIKPRSIFEMAQRWCPWLAAYSGARMGELTQLRGQDVVKVRGEHDIVEDDEEGVWCVKLTPEAGTIKNKTFRYVPLHEHILRQGFVKFARQRGDGPLFYNPPTQPSDEDATNPRRPRAVKIRERLASWIRSLGITAEEISPTHAFRHTFKRIAGSEKVAISERMSDFITGHAPRTVGSGYGAPWPTDMAAALKKFPRYKI